MVITIVGIRDPLRPEVIQIVKSCRITCVVVRVVNGDFIATARAIAKEFAELDKLKILEKVPRLVLWLVHLQWISSALFHSSWNAAKLLQLQATSLTIL